MDFNLIKLVKKTNNYHVHSDDNWIYFISKLYPLPNQGWKIHISCLPSELQSNLRHLLLFLSQKGYSFKIPANLHQSQRLAFGGAGYLSTGKQVTIYLPMTLNEAELENFCIKLNEVLSIKKFPKVITDIQYKNTPLFLRYGGFKSHYRLSESGTKILQIQDENGNWTDDVRQVGHYAPAWIKIPQFLQANFSSNKEGEQAIQIEQINLISRGTKSLVFSAVFRGEKVIIKRSIKQAIIDEAGRDSTIRLQHEIDILKQLQDLSNIPHIVNVIKNDSSLTLIETFAKGMPLTELFNNSPINVNQRDQLITKIVKSLENTLDKIHNHNFVFGDLAPQNIFYTSTGDVFLIDFELTEKINQANPLQGATPGFADLRHGKKTKSFAVLNEDLFGLGAIEFYLATGIRPAFPEALSTIDGYSLVSKLITAADNICKTVVTRQIAQSGIKKIGTALNYNFSSELSENNQLKNIDLSKEIIDNAARYFGNKLRNQISSNHFNSSLDKGLSGILIGTSVLMEHTNVEPYIMSLYSQGMDNLIKNTDSYENISLINGSISNMILFGINNCQDELTTCLNSLLLYPLFKVPLGLFHGLAGMLLTCSITFKYASDKSRDKLSRLIKKIITEITQRTYRSHQWPLSFDVGPKGKPQLQISPNLGFGLAGLLIGLTYANDLLDNKKVYAISNQIYQELYSFMDQNKMLSYSGSLSLSHGFLGIWLSFLLFDINDSSHSANLLGNLPLINERKDLRPDNFSLKTGYAGYLYFEHLLKQFPQKGLITNELNIKKIIIGSSSTMSGRYTWTNGITYLNKEDRLLTGDLGIYLSLLSTLDK